MRVYTVGHSNLAAPAFLALLAAHGIEALCDVRAFPRSRRWPQFNGDALAAALAEAGVAYHWLGQELGGYRKSRRADSPHTSLGDSVGFRAYADHMETAGFRSGIARLLGIARGARTACMCAEKNWRQCHRRHISDHLVALEGVEVVHLLDETTTESHRVDPRSRVEEGVLIYDRGRQARLF